jgi:hypothetical protein
MENVIQFVHDLYGKFFGGLWEMIKALLSCFDVRAYWGIIQNHKQYLGRGTGIIAGGAAFLLFLTIAAILFALVMLLRRGFLLRGSVHAQSHLIQEVNSLNKEVMRLNLEKDKILSMKVSQIGLNPNEISNLTGEEMQTLLESQQGDVENGSRFFHLTKVDEEMAHYIPPVYDNHVTLPAICELFRNYCASNLGLYYEPKIIRLFLASFSCTRLIILQGISGTGKTSLPYAFGKFLENDATIVSVQPSWRDRSELFGYFNEFTKRYNETELLAKMYEATYNENIYVSILDEMNIARVEYYFAELLSIMEMPSRDEWIVDIVPSSWANDPKNLKDGKLKLPENMWYIGTANNDDSTFAITDKVYDRAMTIDINSKGVPFDAPKTPPLHLNFRHFEGMLDTAKLRYRVSEQNLAKVDMLDDYVIEHFRLAFGNRIVKQLREFVPAYVGCGGTELEGLDYVLCKKVFRKFEGLNLSYIRDEIDGLCNYLDELFGRNTMAECKAYLYRLKRLI